MKPNNSSNVKEEKIVTIPLNKIFNDGKQARITFNAMEIQLIRELAKMYCQEATSLIKENWCYMLYNKLDKIMKKQNIPQMSFCGERWETRVHVKLQRQCLQCEKWCMPWLMPKGKEDFPDSGACSLRKVKEKKT